MKKWLGFLGAVLRAILPFLGRDGRWIAEAASKVVGSLESLDLGRDRERLIIEMVDVAAELGLDWLTRGDVTIDELRRMNTFDFRQWAASFRLAERVAREKGAGEIPALDLARSTVNAAVSLAKRR